MITEKIAKCPWVDGWMDGHNVVHRTTGYYSALKRKEVLTPAKHGWTLSHSVSSVAQSCLTVCDPMDCSTPGLPVHHQLLELAQTHVHQVWWCHRTISSFVTPFSFRLQSFPASRSFLMSQFFASSGQSIWSFSFSTSPSSEYLGLISFRIDWLDLQCVAVSSVQSLSHVWLCNPMDCSMPGFPVHHKLPELAQTHAHRDNDAIQPSHPWLSPSHPAFNLSQYQGLLQWVSSLPQVSKVLEFQLHHQSFQWIFRTDFL